MDRFDPPIQSIRHRFGPVRPIHSAFPAGWTPVPRRFGGFRMMCQPLISRRFALSYSFSLHSLLRHRGHCFSPPPTGNIRLLISDTKLKNVVTLMLILLNTVPLSQVCRLLTLQHEKVVRKRQATILNVGSRKRSPITISTATIRATLSSHH